MKPNNIHHVGIAVPSIEKALKFHVEALGMKQITDVVFDELQNVKVVLLSPEETEHEKFSYVELVESVGSSPVDQILKQRNRLYHYCIEVPNIEEALEKARKQHAIIVLPPTPAKLFNDRKIAFVWTPAQYLLEFLEKE
ncbi:MAG: VOC family protein [Candidatus Heimdallarchaeota archaeon]|nr:VOC family protein [Candidatus Heimdallarchaeota archaeon]MBY8994011.1 VOC family protein [Candidatus Heimdallarchaeota archaeon]